MNEIVWDMKDKVRDQEGQISSLREELRKLQKQSDHDVEVARIEATELRSLVQGLREEIESLNRRVAILFTEMVKMKRLLAPMREEKDKQRSVYEEALWFN